MRAFIIPFVRRWLRPLRHFYEDRYEAYSAGRRPSQVDPYAVRVMAEVGVNISHHRSKGLQEFQDVEFDYVVTVCDQAKEERPFFHGVAIRLQKSYEDPSKFEWRGEAATLHTREGSD